MILGFYYHVVLHYNEKGIKTAAYLGVFIDSLAVEVTKLILFGHSALDSDIDCCDYELKGKNIEFVDLGYKTPFWDRVLFPGKALNHINSIVDSCDYILVRAPTPLAPHFYFKFGRRTKIVFMMVGDYIKVLKVQRESLLRKFPVSFFIYLCDFMQNRAIRKCVTFVNSKELLIKYKGKAKELFEIKTTTLSLSDFYSRRDSFSNSNEAINLLFTGRINPSKGVFNILILASKLIISGLEVKVHFVGWEDDGSKPVEKEIKKEASRLGILGRIYFHGYKSVGPELFSMYRMAQIYILPSQSEGFPRTIWEAMANSVPVIATKVGSIPYFIENEIHALLVPPEDPEALYIAAKRIITDEHLRETIIANAFTFVRQITLDIQTKRMMEIIKSQSNA